MNSLIHCLSSENFIWKSEDLVGRSCDDSRHSLWPRSLTYWLEYWIAAGLGHCAWKCSWCHPRRSRDYASCASWACPETESWHYTDCINSNCCVMAWCNAHIDGFLITGFGIMWWGAVSEDTHNPHKSDPQAQTNLLIFMYMLKKLIFCFSKRKLQWLMKRRRL